MGARPGIEPASSWILVRFVSAEPQWELLISILQFSVNLFFTSLLKCISKYFILLDAMVYGVAFLIALSSSCWTTILNRVKLDQS